MADYNPYAAPRAVDAGAPGQLQAYGTAQYVPLGWRTMLATIAIVAQLAMSVAMELAQIAFGDELHATGLGGKPNLAAAAIIGLAGIGALLAQILSWVFVGIWVYRAAANLRGLGRYGMQFSPGGCVGWYFVPIANLVQPFKAMREIWRASDPEGPQGSWLALPTTPLLGIWWGTWLVSGVVAWGEVMASEHPATAGSIGLLSTGLRAVAGISLIVLMRTIGSRQERSASSVPVQ